MKHAYITTEQIPGIENMPNVRDHDASVYLKLQGDALHIGGYENNPVFLDRVSSFKRFFLIRLQHNFILALLVFPSETQKVRL